MTHLFNLLRSRAWWKLEPDYGTLIVSGQSTEENFSPGAVAADRSFALVYFPAGQALNLNMAAFADLHVVARWYDPVSGDYTAVAGSPFSSAGIQTLVRADKNAGGSHDWVLVLESTP